MSATRAIVKVSGKAVKVGNTSDWRGLIATFASEQDVKESSRKLYTRTLTQYFLWLRETGRVIDSLTRIDILEYKDHLHNEGLSALTIGSYLVVVRKFYEWAEAHKLYPNIAKGIKTPKRIQAFRKQHLTDIKSSELLNHFEEAISEEEEVKTSAPIRDAMSLRNYAIVNLILRTGLRTIEVVRANIGDITFKGDRRILKVWGKGKDIDSKEEDFVVLSQKAYKPIAEYLSTRRGARAGEPLFTSTSRQNAGERLTTRTISGLCKDGLRSIGLDGKEYTAHSLRHTTAVAMIKHGASQMDVQGVLRHSSPVTTQIYLESVKEEMRLQNAPEIMLDNAF